MLGECIISSVLSHHSKNLKRQTSVSAQLQLSLNGKPVLQLGYSSVLFGKHIFFKYKTETCLFQSPS